MHLVEQEESREALGGTTTLGLVHTDASRLPAMFAELWRAVFTFERQFSRFIPESELSVFNSKAGLTMPISNEFHALLRAALDLAQQTDGLFNPFTLPAVQRAGYVSSAVPRYASEPVPDYTNRRIVAPDALELGDTWARIPYGTAIDLGGCGKGYLADQLGEIAKAHGTVGYWLELSGDIATYGHDAAMQPLTVAIQNATTLGTNYSIIAPREAFGIATSGTFRRSSQKHTLHSHHIIDPTTGKPAQTDIALATVCAPAAVTADVLASCAVLLGATRAPAYLASHGATSWALQIRTTTGIDIITEGPHIHATTEVAYV